MLPEDPAKILHRLLALGNQIRSEILKLKRTADLAIVDRDSASDIIYRLDTAVEPLIEDFCRDWSRTLPLVLIGEGIEAPGGEGIKVFPEGRNASDASIRLIIDPIDGTRGLMYDKRSAWFLAGVALNRGPLTRLRDIEVSVMSELPTSKMGFSDVLWAIKGNGARG